MYIKHLLLYMMAADFVVLVLAFLLVFKLIPQNKFFGFKNSRTFSSKDLWFKANSVVGKGILLTTGICLLSLLVLFFVRKSLPALLIYLLGFLFCLIPYMVLSILTVFKAKENK